MLTGVIAYLVHLKAGERVMGDWRYKKMMSVTENCDCISAAQDLCLTLGQLPSLSFPFQVCLVPVTRVVTMNSAM